MPTLPPYPAYRPSGVEWLGEIPAHWEVRRLKSFATVHLSNVDKKSKEGEGAVQLCNYVDVYYNEQINAGIDFMPATSTRAQAHRFSLRSGDVLITKDSETWTDIAIPAVVTQDLPGVLCGYHLAHIRSGNSCDGAFLSRAFEAIGPRDQYQVSANGITRFGLTGDSIRSSALALPPLPEQRAIAGFLDRETAKIDALVAKKERLIELHQEKRSALISHAVTRGLDPNAPMKDSSVEWLGEIPAHWEVKRLKFSAPFRTRKLDSKPDETIYVGLENIESWTGRLLLDNQPDSVDGIVGFFNAGDVLFGKLRPYLAKLARPNFDGVSTSEILALCPQDECLQSYLMYCLLNKSYILWIDNLTYGAKMPRVSPDQVASSFMPLHLSRNNKPSPRSLTTRPRGLMR